MEIVHSSVHMGTTWTRRFITAPRAKANPAKQIMDVPLEWCYGPGVVLDFTHLKFPDFIDTEKVVVALKKINYKLKPMDIVLFYTGGGQIAWHR